MDPIHPGATIAQDPQAIAATIEQKALRLSALLREVDNHPVELDAATREQLDEVLAMVGVRIAATRTLLRQRTSGSAASPE